MTTMTMVTPHGPLDLCFTPAGGGYDQLAARQVVVHLADVEIRSPRSKT